MKIYITPYNICRVLLALNTLLALFLNDNYVLFGEIIRTGVFYEEFGLFFLLSDHLVLAKAISLIVLFMVILGFYPRFTSIPHFYISYSFVMATDVNFGADRIASNILFLLIPICLLDNRKNHFLRNNTPQNNYIYWFFYTAIIIQVSLIYFQSFYKKILIPEWRNGTAVFYYITHNEFGLGRFDPVNKLLLKNKFLIYIMTWGALAIELTISTVILFKSFISLRKKELLLACGILFHFTLTFAHGLFPFLLVMSGVLFIYIFPLDYQKKIEIKFRRF
jgi:antimicrobial peptide system SdpB family protein|tara:strand:- start:151 stop:984 length:834 start_codon:yes stop_codon:yes gene_type:complete